MVYFACCQIFIAFFVVCNQTSCALNIWVFLNNLNWSNRINFICDKIIKFTSIFYKLLKLRLTLIFIYLPYIVWVYVNTYSTHLTKLNTLNNKILCILQNQSHRLVLNVFIKIQCAVKIDTGSSFIGQGRRASAKNMICLIFYTLMPVSH